MPEEKLSAKHKRFVAEYLIDRSATQAAIRAGYSKKTARQIGSKLLTKVDIQQLVNNGEEKLREKLQISQEYVLETIHDTIERCRQAKPVLNKKGEQVYCEDPKGDVLPAYTFNSNAVLKGSELLGKHLGMFTDKLEVTGKGGKDLISADSNLKLDIAKRMFLALKDPKILNNLSIL